MTKKRYDTEGWVVQALNAEIEKSGSVARFAEKEVMRSVQTVYRWKSGESPIPQSIRKWLLTKDLNPLMNERQRKVSK
jgi:hypothetical protein